MAGVLSPIDSLQSTVTSEPAPIRPLCTICNHHSIYTCPGCSTRTCSLLCSSNHKSTTGCTGQRNKAAYVPMNRYGWGTMMDDYVFLEDVGRRVGDWGKEIIKGGFTMKNPNTRGGEGRGRDISSRWRGRNGGNTKRDTLKIQLEARDIDMDLLPIGMERRRVNQSSWDIKNHTAILTIEYNFYPPINPLAPSSQHRDPPFTILTHKNSMNKPLLTLLQTVITERANYRKEGACPSWIQSLVLPDSDDPESFTPPQCVMTARIDPLTVVGPAKAAFHRLDPSKTLDVLLRNTHFVEFPTIEVWEEFRGTIVDAQGAVTQELEEEPKSKRRKLSTKAGKKAMTGLLGGYGSESEGGEGTQNVLALLGGYAESDEDTGPVNDQDDLGDEDADGDTDDEAELDPATLLDLVREVQGSERWLNDIADDDMVDWGDDLGENE
ncbi:hypothetical protein BDZ94DRAFT_1244800 [Collybia nuda]|uniref:HIT-type domain-containing protein n=1 Tax=Collybia nuda TaxID=64659 RepID=A0A9P5YF82_9AGAR|nr:hypothetical protein BDZ94DRAFT_1244800 [Collybia nuda]